ncbi:MAG: ABC transporter permease [Chloroflexi bacterium]|nr:ABC transporter permease [Chloroflexota bacterium]
MSWNRTTAIAKRVISQVLRDRRTLGLIFFVPIVVMSLVGFSFADQRFILDSAAPALLAVFALFFTFVLTGVSFLRERAYGTLERLLATPVGRGDIIVGYLAGFLLFAGMQSLIILLFTILALQVHYQGALWQIFLLLMVLTIVGVNLGIFVSTFARNEFQVVQFIPLVLAPQIFLSGILLPVAQMPWYFRGASKVFPLTYAVEGLRDIMLRGMGLLDVLPELGVLAAFAVALIVLATGVVRRA